MQDSIELVVRGFHIDVFGHVNNARYLEFLEEARWALLGDTVMAVRERNWTYNIVNMNINYRAATVLGQTLVIDARVTRVGNTSFTIRQEIIIKETRELAADAEMILVISDNKTGKALPFAGEVEEIFSDHIADTVK